MAETRSTQSMDVNFINEASHDSVSISENGNIRIKDSCRESKAVSETYLKCLLHICMRLLIFNSIMSRFCWNSSLSTMWLKES